jgi:hypothetical protein
VGAQADGAGRIGPPRIVLTTNHRRPTTEPLRDLGVGDVLLALGHEQGAGPVQDHVVVDHALADVVHRGDLVHHLEQDLLDRGPEAAGAGLPLLGLLGGRLQRLGVKIRSTLSSAKNFWYCLTTAFFGSTRIRFSSRG